MKATILLALLLKWTVKVQHSDEARSNNLLLKNLTRRPERTSAPEVPSCMVKDGVKGMFTFQGFSPCDRYCTPGKWIHILCKFCCIRKSEKPEGKKKKEKKQKAKDHGHPNDKANKEDSLMYVGIGAVAFILVPCVVWLLKKRRPNIRNSEEARALPLQMLNIEDAEDDTGQRQAEARDQNDDEVQSDADANGEQGGDHANANNGNEDLMDDEEGGLGDAVLRDNAVEQSESLPHEAMDEQETDVRNG